MMKKVTQGFTLIEMLVVISILSVVGVLILNIFTRTLRGGNKTQIIGTIKQNGQSILENMDKTIRSSDNVVCPTITPPATSSGLDTLVVVKNGVYTRYRFISPNSTDITYGDCKSVNGCILQDNPTKQNVDTNPPRQETDPEFITSVCNVGSLMPRTTLSPVTIISDTNPQTGISVDCIAPDCNANPIFKRDRSSGYRDQVTIKFDLWPGKEVSSAVAGQIDPVTFQTTIQLR